MASSYDKLIDKLKEIFQLDQADLDFGIYRIMNQKRGEITSFLEQDLLPQVREAFAAYHSANRQDIEAQLNEAIEQARGLGADPESLPKVKELREKLKATADIAKLEDEVYSDLYSFFRRYYNEGDFISQRRYKNENTYVIPYKGEEVKLHWANADQYYVKTTESFRDYTFKLPSGKRVHFKVVDASTDKDNNKSTNGNGRRFVLSTEQPISEENGELVIPFEYQPSDKKAKQADLNNEAVKAILATEGLAEWTTGLSQKAPTGKNPNRTVLEKQLTQYTAKNTFDYFVHKDLGKFLRRELDFYIKNEVMHLDDVESESAPKVEQYLSKIKAIRRIAHKIIDFLAQIEDFQKKLWLKKKFVVETNYCITLDRVPKELYPEIAVNDAQREEWVQLFAIDEIKRTVLGLGYTKPLAVEFLEANPHLVVDTRFFDDAFKAKLLSSVDGIDERTNGLIVNSENFQTLWVLLDTLREEVKCIYIDPPYNRKTDGFPYKDNYQHSSWLSMMTDRLRLASCALERKGVIFVSIDENERDNLTRALDGVFGRNNRVAEAIWAQNSTHSQSPTYSINHEYVEAYARSLVDVEQDAAMFREPKPGCVEIMELVSELNPSYPPLAAVERAIRELMNRHVEEYKEELLALGLPYDEETKKQDPWRGVYNYHNVEYRDRDGRYVREDDARDQGAMIWVWKESDPSVSSQKQADSTRDPSDPNYRFYRPVHPFTGKQCPATKRGWAWPYQWENGDRESFSRLDADHRIVWGKDESKVPQVKRFLHEVETNVAKSVFHDYTDGEKELERLFGRTGVFSSTPKPTTLVRRFAVQTTRNDEVVMDFFAGSGTTGHAVIDLNREDQGNRKYVLVEMGAYLDTVVLPRLKKVVYSKDWKDGKPVSRQGSSHAFKYIRLESYEDALNNLALKRTKQQQEVLDLNQEVKEDYMMRYMLDVESRGSASLLNIDAFEDPFNYKLDIATGDAGETRPTVVDLVETFNYLLGLKVKHIDSIRGFRVVEGTNPAGDKVLVIWRNLKEKSNEDLDDFFTKQRYNIKDLEFDLIYVNGDNNLENLRLPDQTWKVRLIEEHFQKLMFDVEDV